MRGRRARAAGRRAFTILEVLIVIALIGMFATLFIINLDTLVSQSAAESVETAFWESAREARTRSLLEREPYTLRYDEDKSAFVVEALGGGWGRSFEINREQWAPNRTLEIALKKRLARSQFTLVRGQLVDLRTVPSVTYYPDGTCTPFVFTMDIDGVSEEFEIDPWTGAQLLAVDGQ